eukprot:2414900-Pleurochrysis_carterae.AAC.1
MPRICAVRRALAHDPQRKLSHELPSHVVLRARKDQAYETGARERRQRRECVGTVRPKRFEQHAVQLRRAEPAERHVHRIDGVAKHVRTRSLEQRAVPPKLVQQGAEVENGGGGHVGRVRSGVCGVDDVRGGVDDGVAGTIVGDAGASLVDKFTVGVASSDVARCRFGDGNRRAQLLAVRVELGLELSLSRVRGHADVRDSSCAQR